MSDKDIFDACTKLSEIAAGRLDFRRQIEWRLSIAIWTALIASIAWFRVSALPVWVGASILLAHASWLQGLFVRNAEDTKILWHYFHEAQAILARQEVRGVEDRPDLRVGTRLGSTSRIVRLVWNTIGFLSSWALRFEFFVTVALTAIAYLVCANQISWLVLRPLASATH